MSKAFELGRNACAVGDFFRICGADKEETETPGK
jgi:hypothetical protein